MSMELIMGTKIYFKTIIRIQMQNAFVSEGIEEVKQDCTWMPDDFTYNSTV